MTIAPTTTTVRLKDGTTYQGLYRIKVTHLPLSAVAALALVLIFGTGFALLMVWDGPYWAQLATGYFTASFLLGLLRDLWHLLVQAQRT